MDTRSDNIEITIGDDNDDIIEELFKSFIQKYEENLPNKMRGSDFEFDGFNSLYYDFNEINLNRSGSYIDSPKWLKDKKSTINLKNNDNKCFHHERLSKIKPFINQYNWKDIDFPPTSKDWKKFEFNNEVALIYIPHNTRKMQVVYKSKNNLTCDKQVILLMVTNGEKWHYLTVKNLPGLLRGITSTNKEDFYCLNCFHSYSTRNKLESHKKICKNHNYSNVEMPTENNNIIKYNQGEKSIKLPFVVYADLECLLEKMISLTTEEKIYHNEQEICYICKKEFDENNSKVRDHCHYTGKYRGAAHNICNLRYKIPKEILVVFHNGSTYDYHFIIKELVNKLDGSFECLGENTGKYITLSVPIKRKIENKNFEITYKIKLIDSYRFMSMSLSKLIDNLSEGIHNNKSADSKSCLDYIKTKNEKLILKCFNCEQYYKKKFNKELIKRFASTYEFCNKDLNKFILLLRKGVYPYECMDNWERFNETSLPNKESFYSNLNMENIEDIDYRHGNKYSKYLS